VESKIHIKYGRIVQYKGIKNVYITQLERYKIIATSCGKFIKGREIFTLAGIRSEIKAYVIYPSEL
jgi:hypothetical protein